MSQKAYEEPLHRAEAAARIRDSSQFVGALREAFSAGYNPSHIPSSWLALISDEKESIESLRGKRSLPLRLPSIGNPAYTPMTEYKGKPLTSEVYHDYLLKQTFKPFEGFSAAGWELERRLSELHSIGVDLHDYRHAHAHALRVFWPEVVLAVSNHARELVGNDFVDIAKVKYGFRDID
ncbi:MAG TPA: hypothetical protein VHA12_02135 [Candidatus Nanoarchaeia archaeon]|nr:hypothetical protein [Candidatus Nanoarchaeia archaeon]